MAAKPKARPPEDQDDDCDLPDLATDPQFLKFVEAQGGLGLDPLSDEGLRLQAQYVKTIGDHPLDTLKSLSSNVFVKPSDRIAAAKALLEYGARKVPAQFEVTGTATTLSISPAQFSGLSSKELDQLEKLLSKAAKSSEA